MAPHCPERVRRAHSLEKTLMLGKIEGRRRRGRQRMRWLDGITDSMDVNLGEPRVPASSHWPRSLASPEPLVHGPLTIPGPALHSDSIPARLSSATFHSCSHPRGPLSALYSVTGTQSQLSPDWHTFSCISLRSPQNYKDHGPLDPTGSLTSLGNLDVLPA